MMVATLSDSSSTSTLSSSCPNIRRSTSEVMKDVENMQQSIRLLKNLVNRKTRRAQYSEHGEQNSKTILCWATIPAGEGTTDDDNKPDTGRLVKLIPFVDPILPYRTSSPCRSSFRSLSTITQMKRNIGLPRQLSSGYISDSTTPHTISHPDTDVPVRDTISALDKQIPVKLPNLKNGSISISGDISTTPKVRQRLFTRRTTSCSDQQSVCSGKLQNSHKAADDGEIGRVCLESWLSDIPVPGDMCSPVVASALVSSSIRSNGKWSFSTRDLEDADDQGNRDHAVTLTPDLASYRGRVSMYGERERSVSTSPMDQYICNCEFGNECCIIHGSNFNVPIFGSVSPSTENSPRSDVMPHDTTNQNHANLRDVNSEAELLDFIPQKQSESDIAETTVPKSTDVLVDLNKVVEITPIELSPTDQAHLEVPLKGNTSPHDQLLLSIDMGCSLPKVKSPCWETFDDHFSEDSFFSDSENSMIGNIIDNMTRIG